MLKVIKLRLKIWNFKNSLMNNYQVIISWSLKWFHRLFTELTLIPAVVSISELQCNHISDVTPSELLVLLHMKINTWVSFKYSSINISSGSHLNLISDLIWTSFSVLFIIMLEVSAVRYVIQIYNKSWTKFSWTKLPLNVYLKFWLFTFAKNYLFKFHIVKLYSTNVKLYDKISTCKKFRLSSVHLCSSFDISLGYIGWN